MKRNILFLLSICMLLLTCSDGDDPIKKVEKPPLENEDPFITLKKSTVDFTNEGGSEGIAIESNITWTAKSSDSWCKVSPTSGNKSTESIKITVDENETYEDRDCTITIEGEGITKTITVNQGENLGLLITQDRYELGNEESTIKVEVKANVEFEVEINDEWITQVETRGLTSTDLTFEIAKNESYSNREGSITISQIDGDLSSTITVYQSQENAIILSEKEVEISDRSQTLEVIIKTNVDIDVIIQEDDQDWVSYTPTRGLREETVSLSIAANNSDKVRSTEVFIKDKATSLQETLTITQIGKEPGVYYVEEMGTLGSTLSQAQKDTITTMIIKGEINSSDFYVMNSYIPRLKHLDLTDVRCDNNEIPYAAFSQNKTISTIEFPLSITKIGAYAFNGCTNLKGPLNLPSKLTSIDQAAFQNCTSITGSLIIPDGITVIEAWIFNGCSNLDGTLTLPKNLTKIENTSFQNCSGLTGDLIIPDGVTTIGEWAFNMCSGFTGTLKLPKELTYIGRSAFQLCSGFTGNLIIPDGVNSIDEHAFFYCSGFTRLLMGSNIITINQSAFSYCLNISGDISFPISLSYIGEQGFLECRSVNSFIFPHDIPISYNTNMLQRHAKVIVPLYSVAIYKSANGWDSHNIVGRGGSPSGNFTDPRDGNVYKTVTIGNQEWMAENLKYLPSVVGSTAVSRLTPYYYVYGYNGTDVNVAKAKLNYSIYGVLYNWSAAMSGSESTSANPSRIQGVCPTGWHLPSDAEWGQLTDFLGGENIAGDKLKEAGIGYFTALPGGATSGTFLKIDEVGYWWSATEDGAFNAISRAIGASSSISTFGIPKSYGFSVRCVKD